MHVQLVVVVVVVLLPLTHMYITAAAAAVVLQFQLCCLNVLVVLEMQGRWPPNGYKQQGKHTAMWDLDHATTLAICVPQCTFTFMLFSRLCTCMLPLLCYNSNSDCLIVLLIVLEMQTKWPPSRYKQHCRHTASRPCNKPCHWVPPPPCMFTLLLLLLLLLFSQLCAHAC